MLGWAAMGVFAVCAFVVVLLGTPTAGAGQTETGHATASLAAQRDISPRGLTLHTLPEAGSMMHLGGEPVPGTEFHQGRIAYMLLNRATLAIEKTGSFNADVGVHLPSLEPGGIQQLSTLIDGYTGSLVVLNWAGFDRFNIYTEREHFALLLQKIGAQRPTDAQLDGITEYDPNRNPEPLAGSAIGVAGAPAGSAFVKFADGHPASRGGMTGFLRPNGATGTYDFVFTDPVEFDTETNGPPTDQSPAQLTVKIGANTYTQPNPGGGTSGFHLVIVSANTHDLIANHVYATNAADGAEHSGEVLRLAHELRSAADNPHRPLVFLQAFGTPHGADAPWGQAAKQIELLGGTEQVFAALNAVEPRPLNGEDSNRKGPYAFVGRVNSGVPSAEQSHPLNGLPGRLQGVLMRGHDGYYDPTFAAPPRSDGQPLLNTELLHVLNQAPRPFPAFTDTTGAPVGQSAAQAVEKFLGGPDVAKLCSATAPVCDIRKEYYEDYRANWSSIQDDLTNAQGKCAEPHEGFTSAQCEGIRRELHNEVSMVAKVTAYFGPDGLQQPFGTASVLGQADLHKISQEIQDAVKPPAADNTTAFILGGIGKLLALGAAAPPPASSFATGLSAAFAAAAYFTQDNGSPNIIGPAVATKASKLGVRARGALQTRVRQLRRRGAADRERLRQAHHGREQGQRQAGPRGDRLAPRQRG